MRLYFLSVSEIQTLPLQLVANSEPCVAVMCHPQVNLLVTGHFCASVTACQYEVIVFTLCIEPLALYDLLDHLL